MNFLNAIGLDWYYLVLVVPALILSLIASSMVKSRFAEYDKIPSKKGITGAQAAKILMQENDISDVQINRISGSLTDNYSSTDKTLNLSESTYSSTSIAAIGVAAHETGHAIQDKTSYGPLGLRHTLYPVANIGSRFGPTMAILGIIFGASTQNAQLYSI
jgi:Zn-dependent membrane protease YugP